MEHSPIKVYLECANLTPCKQIEGTALTLIKEDRICIIAATEVKAEVLISKEGFHVGENLQGSNLDQISFSASLCSVMSMPKYLKDNTCSTVTLFVLQVAC